MVCCPILLAIGKILIILPIFSIYFMNIVMNTFLQFISLHCFNPTNAIEPIPIIINIYTNELIFKNGKLDGVKINVDSDKAKSARIKIEEWNIPKEEIVVIVDGANDIKLFDISNLGIAYRAQDLVKELATTTLEEKDLRKIIPIINKHYSMELPVPISS